jgi:hypothetical protein
LLGHLASFRGECFCNQVTVTRVGSQGGPA